MIDQVVLACQVPPVASVAGYGLLQVRQEPVPLHEDLGRVAPIADKHLLALLDMVEGSDLDSLVDFHIAVLGAGVVENFQIRSQRPHVIVLGVVDAPGLEHTVEVQHFLEVDQLGLLLTFKQSILAESSLLLS